MWALSWQNATTSEVIFVIESLLQWLHLSQAMGLSSTIFKILNKIERFRKSEEYRNFEQFKKCMRKSFWSFQKILISQSFWIFQKFWNFQKFCIFQKTLNFTQFFNLSKFLKISKKYDQDNSPRRIILQKWIKQYPLGRIRQVYFDQSEAAESILTNQKPLTNPHT